MSAAHASGLTFVEFVVAHVPGLPAEHASLAERRVGALLPGLPPAQARSVAYLTLALLRLRQAGPADQAEAERLGGQALAAAGLPADLRPSAFAAVVASRQSRGMPYEDVLARAAAASPAETGLDVEQRAAEFRAIADPAAFLAAFRAGDPGTRLGASPVAAMLRGQGRGAELLELHRGFAAPSGRYARQQMKSLHAVEYQLLLMPALPPETVGEGAVRVEWILGNYPFEGPEDRFPRAAVQHTLALARLRQRRFAEVEPLCAPTLAGDYGRDGRATVLATVALARRALGQPYAELLAQAIALSPDADLVAEAAQPAPPAGTGARRDRELAAQLAPSGQQEADSA